MLTQELAVNDRMVEKMVSNTHMQRGRALGIAVGTLLIFLALGGGASALSGGTLAFVSDKGGSDNLYKINTDKSGLTQLTSSGNIFESEWSPDGAQIAFSINNNYGNLPDRGIWKIKADGSSSSRLTTNHGDYDFQWSPDGTKIIFRSQRTNFNGWFHVWMMNSDGSNQHSIASNGCECAQGWSPDSNKIVYAMAGYAGWAANIYVINADGTGNANRASGKSFCTALSWSPDSSKIAYVSQETGNKDIFIINPDGTGKSQLTSNSADDTLERNQNQIWSADSQKIVFESNRNGNWDVYSINKDGSGLTQLTNNAANDYYPTWSPDGTKIAFISERSGMKSIWVMNSDGSNQVQVTDNAAGNVKYLDWSPMQSNDMVAEYHFDGNAQDTSGNGNHGTINGATSVQGISGQALSFDGNDWVDIPDNIAPSQITLAAWIKKTDDSNGFPIITKETGSGTPNGFGWRLHVETGNVITYTASTGIDKRDIYSNTVLSKNKWYYVVGTYDGNKMKLYINGLLEGETPLIGNLNQNNMPTAIGHLQGWSVQWFKGIIDEAKIYNRALDANEIKAEYDKLAPPTVTSISVSPSPATVPVGNQQIFEARDQDNKLISVDWTLTGDTSVGTLSTSTGTSTTFTALKAGAATVRATSGGVVGSAEVTVENTVEAITPVSTIWENEEDGMIVPYDQVEMRFTFKNNLPTTLHNVKLIFKKNNLISFDKQETFIGDVSPGQFSNIEPVSIKIAGVDNNDIITKIIDINGPGKIPLTNSIDVTVQYDSGSKAFPLTPTDISKKTLEIQYPNFKTNVGDPIPKDDIGDYYMEGDTSFSHGYTNLDTEVRKHAVKGGAYLNGIFPDNPESVTFNVFRYVDSKLEPDVSKSNIENDIWIANRLGGELNSNWICIAHSYLFTSFERALGFPSREIDVAEGTPSLLFGTFYEQNAAAEIWYNKKWNFYDPWTSRTEAFVGIYVNNDILSLDNLLEKPLPIIKYKTWYAFDKQYTNIYGEISGNNYLGHDFTICSFEIPGFPCLSGPGAPKNDISQWKKGAEGSAGKSNIIIAGSPIEMLIIDNQGRSVGSEESGIVNEIPGSKYMPPGQIGYSNRGDPSTAFELDEFISIPEGLNGKYDLIVKGTGDGEFTLQFAKFDPSSQNEYSGVTTLTGIIKKDEIQSYEVNIDGTAIAAIKIDTPPPSQVPEFPTLALPILSVIGLLFVLRRWR